jgi:Cu+-exporting ATPase
MDGTTKNETLQLSVSGMTCGGCASRVEQTLLGVPGVIDASVNLVLETAVVTVRDSSFNCDELVERVTEAGYPSEFIEPAGAARNNGEKGRQNAAAKAFRYEIITLVVSALLSAPLLLMMILPPMGVSYALPAWAQMILATPIQFWVGARFYIGAWNAVRARAGNMDVLVAVGTSAAYGLSVWIMFDGGLQQTVHLYFEASALVITLVVAGKLLEAHAKKGTAQAIRTLMDLRPQTACVLRDGMEVTAPIDQVGLGDVVLVRPGERIPVDGEIISGVTETDESMMTGESRPVSKSIGSPVIGGSINGTSVIEIRTTKIGEDSTLAKIIKLVENAQSGKAPMQRLVDRISHIFVPIVLMIAAATLIGWAIMGAGLETAIINAVSVLVIACPCALGLATPSAIVAGTGAAARAGILIKDIAVLECAHNVDVVAFDKTGTLTRGTPTVNSVNALNGDEDNLIRVAAAVQAGSEHPLAHAILEIARDRNLLGARATAVTAHQGRGISGEFSGDHVLIGNRALMGENEVLLSAHEQQLATIESQRMTPVLVAMNGELVGFFGLSDGIRPEAKSSIQMLAARGVHAMMLSGDTLPVAKKIGAGIGMTDIRAPLTPDEKFHIIQAERHDGHTLAMVGDGINDAAALAAADVSIAMGSGSDVAIETAGITLMRPDPRLVAAALDVAGKTWARIKWNLFWAFIFNVIGLPLAAFGYLSPVVAGTAMALSSITVVSNSLLLRRWRPSGIED